MNPVRALTLAVAMIHRLQGIRSSMEDQRRKQEWYTNGIQKLVNDLKREMVPIGGG